MPAQCESNNLQNQTGMSYLTSVVAPTIFKLSVSGDASGDLCLCPMSACLAPLSEVLVPQ